MNVRIGPDTWQLRKRSTKIKKQDLQISNYRFATGSSGTHSRTKIVKKGRVGFIKIPPRGREIIAVGRPSPITSGKMPRDFQTSCPKPSLKQLASSAKRPSGRKVM